ncbi:MAG: DHH family phosphoesterase [Saprospiraceae bacterium]
MSIPSELKQLLHYPQNVAIFSHRNPDGDAIGSALAMQHYLQQYGHTVHVLFPSEYPAEFEFLPLAEEILIWDIHTEECKQVLNKKNVFVFLDFNALNRIDKLGEYIKNLPGPRILIDHHLYPDPIADYTFSEPAASSTCELVYRFITDMGDGQKINPSVGMCLYSGIVTDTGSFKHATNSAVFRIVADLIDRGMDDTDVQDRIFNSQKEKNLRLLGHCLANRMEYLPEFRTAYVWLSRKDYEDFDIQRGDTEGIVNYLLTIRDVRLAALIHNQPTIVKLSLRSKGDLDVQEICRTHFSGGGHKNASGAYSHDSLKSTVQKFRDLLPLYKNALLKTNH